MSEGRKNPDVLAKGSWSRRVPSYSAFLFYAGPMLTGWDSSANSKGNQLYSVYQFKCKFHPETSSQKQRITIICSGAQSNWHTKSTIAGMEMVTRLGREREGTQRGKEILSSWEFQIEQRSKMAFWSKAKLLRSGSYPGYWAASTFDSPWSGGQSLLFCSWSLASTLDLT